MVAKSTDSVLQVERLHVSYDDGRLVAVDDFSVDIKPGEFVCLLGPTGCGKSTILKAIAGFISPAGGTMLLNGRPINGPGVDRGFVFQSFVLFPWKTVEGNVEFGPKIRGIPATDRRKRCTDILNSVGLADRAKAYPHELSGGMQQRVAIARALVNNPEVLLMDEPFGSLDAQTRAIMQALLLDLWQKYRRVVVFVTHDIDEAIILSDRLLLLSARPARVKEEVVVDLPRPRHPESTVDPDFIRIKRRVLTAMKEEVAKSFSAK